MVEFGNWRVTKEGIEWIGEYNNPDDRNSKLIPLNQVNHTLGNLYEWPIHIGSKCGKREDMYAFNTAFIYALELAGNTLTPAGLLSETFVQQGKVYSANIEDQSDEISIGGGN